MMAYEDQVSFERIDRTTFEREYQAIYHRVFAEYVDDNMPTQTPFADPAWCRIGLAYPFDRDYAHLHLGEAIADDGYPACVDMTEQQFLYDTLADFGISRVIVTLSNPYEWSPPQDVYLCDANYPSINEVFRQLPWGALFLFSEEGIWGVHNGLERTSVLGGTDEFVDAYLTRVGGLEGAKLKFWMEDIASNGFEDRNLPSYAWAVRHYEMLGWEPPQHPWWNAPDDKDLRWDIRIAEIQKHARRLKQIMGWTDENLGIA